MLVLYFQPEYILCGSLLCQPWYRLARLVIHDVFAAVFVTAASPPVTVWPFASIHQLSAGRAWRRFNGNRFALLVVQERLAVISRAEPAKRPIQRL